MQELRSPQPLLPGPGRKVSANREREFPKRQLEGTADSVVQWLPAMQVLSGIGSC